MNDWENLYKKSIEKFPGLKDFRILVDNRLYHLLNCAIFLPYLMKFFLCPNFIFLFLSRTIFSYVTEIFAMIYHRIKYQGGLRIPSEKIL